MRVEQAFHRHDHAGGAEAALEGLVFEKGLLHGIEVAVLRETFDGGDLFVFDIAGECEARADGFAVDQHGARATDADTATFNRSTVIPGKLAKLAGPGIQEFQRHLDALNSRTKCNTVCIVCCNGTMTYSTNFRARRLAIECVDKAAFVELLKQAVVIEFPRVLTFGFRIHLRKLVDHRSKRFGRRVGTRLQVLVMAKSYV